MSLLEIIILALIQGLSEFLPISSSGHLLLPAQLLGWTDQGLAFDVAVHVGSLAAVMIYFRQEVYNLIIGWFGSLVPGKASGQHTEDGKLAWMIIVATLPVILVGLLVKDLVQIYLRAGYVIAATTILFGLLLYWADKRSLKLQQSNISSGSAPLNFKKAFLIGVSQILAIIPGTSRSGITMTTALFLGLDREQSARFSFLLSIPTILGAGTLMTIELLGDSALVNWQELFFGFALSFISAYLCITLFLKWIASIGMTPFVIYRIILGFVIIGVLSYQP